VVSLSLQPFGHKSVYIGSLACVLKPRNWGLLRPFPWGGEQLDPHVIQCGLWAEPNSVPSAILIHPTVWPQYTSITDRTDNVGRRPNAVTVCLSSLTGNLTCRYSGNYPLPICIFYACVLCWCFVFSIYSFVEIV